MLGFLIAETSEYEFKSQVERKKPGNWLKTISAFANGIGGLIIFGVSNDGRVTGLSTPQDDAEIISQAIRDKIVPIPFFTLQLRIESDKSILLVRVSPGTSTPYYYQADGRKEAYIRVGNESIKAPDYRLNELILKGSHQSFDGQITPSHKNDFSFTLLEATYRERTRLKFDASDYVSFGLTDDNGFLTNAGKLMADQHLVYNNRVFCTRWNGLEKGSIFDDALDDKEFEGNLLYLLKASCDFIKIHSRVRFEKKPDYREDKPDYAERAVLEAMVNALIHRDYLITGTEIHLDMYDDRLEIVSPGGMYNGAMIQDCDINELPSSRRNPVLADLFHRMRYMERRGSGLRRICNETQKLPGYTDDMCPVFRSSYNTFYVILKNVNYGQTENAFPQAEMLESEGTKLKCTKSDKEPNQKGLSQKGLSQKAPSQKASSQKGLSQKAPSQKGLSQKGPSQDSVGVQSSKSTKIEQRVQSINSLIISFCDIERTKQEIANQCGYSNITKFTNRYIKPLIESGQLRMTIPEKPNSRLQKYITVKI